jgi:hypothetical protein
MTGPTTANDCSAAMTIPHSRHETDAETPEKPDSGVSGLMARKQCINSAEWPPEEIRSVARHLRGVREDSSSPGAPLAD